MPPEPLIDLARIDFSRMLADREAIRAVNPQRFEMEMLDGILFLEPNEALIAGFKDVRADEFWTRGHFPDRPLMPGVLMCEAAAQLCSFYNVSQKVMDAGALVGFGGMENVRFRAVVRPGDRLVLVGRGQKLNRRQSIFAVQGFVGSVMAFHGDIIGVPLKSEP